MSSPTARRLALSPLPPSLPLLWATQQSFPESLLQNDLQLCPRAGIGHSSQMWPPAAAQTWLGASLWDGIELPSFDSPPCTTATRPSAELGSGPRDFCVPLPRGYCVRGPRRSAGLSPSSDSCRKGPGWVAARPAQSSTGDTGLLTPDLLCKRVTGSLLTGHRKLKVFSKF